jgi:hypothetical protein
MRRVHETSYILDVILVNVKDDQHNGSIARERSLLVVKVWLLNYKSYLRTVIARYALIPTSNLGRFAVRL